MKKSYKDSRGSSCQTYAMGDTTTGITLVALVVTIVVLLILAGITLTYVFGDNSIFKQASDAKLETELAKLEERAGLIYSDKWLEKVSNDVKDKPAMQEIVEELRKDEYIIEEVAISGNEITGIKLSRESMTLGFESSNTIKVTLESSSEPYVYYVLVDEKYYKMSLNNGVVTIDRTSSDISREEGEKITLTAISESEEIATAVANNDTKTVSVTAKNTEGTVGITVTYGNFSKICSVTVKDIPISTALEMNSVRARIAAGYTRWLTAMTTPVDALQEFEWSSSDTSIAIVNSKGVVIAKKAGTATITAKTIDGSNKQGTCEVTVVENVPDVAALTDFQATNTVAKDENGNLITIPGDFKVLTSEGTKVTEGIVVQDREGNEFVWIPVDSVSTGTSQIADDIRLGRYEDFVTKNAIGNYIPKQDADNYTEIVSLNGNKGRGYQELTSNSGNRAAKNLGDFVTKTKANGGYYFGRYEASQGSDNKVKSQYDKIVWTNITQLNAATEARNMYSSNYVESDLINSYSWDTAIIFIQKYSGNSNYANKASVNTSKLNTGIAGDEVCSIHDMASNCSEWSTEYSKNVGGFDGPCVHRGGNYTYNGETFYVASLRSLNLANDSRGSYSFRPLLYLK